MINDIKKKMKMCLNERYFKGSSASTGIKEICIFIQQIPPIVGMTQKSPNIADGAFEYYFKPSNAIAILNPFEFCMPPPLLICYLIIHCYANM